MVKKSDEIVESIEGYTMTLEQKQRMDHKGIIVMAFSFG